LARAPKVNIHTPAGLDAFVDQLVDGAPVILADKTATLRELRRGLVEARRQVLAMAPTMSAVAELQAVGFDDAVTVERMLRDQERQDSLAGSVIVLDEAG